MTEGEIAYEHAAMAVERLARHLGGDGEWREHVPKARELLVNVFVEVWAES